MNFIMRAPLSLIHCMAAPMVPAQSLFMRRLKKRASQNSTKNIIRNFKKMAILLESIYSHVIHCLHTV